MFYEKDFIGSCLQFVCFRDGFGSREKRRGITVGRWRGISLSMRSFVSEFLQFTLATPHFEGLSVTGIYNWRCCRWNWTPQTCDWYLNVGVGGALGLYDFDDSGFLLGVAGSCAFGCHFKNAPISLEVDYRPVIGAVIGGGHDGFFDPGFWNFGLSVKFHF